MVAWTISWAVSGLLTALFVGQIAKPRLPVYELNLQYPGLFPRWNSDGRMVQRIHTSLQLHNDNYANIDVQSLTFDIFYMGWDGKLELIGQVQDKYQIQYGNSTTMHPPLWRIGGRQDFYILDDIYLSTNIWSILKTLLLLIWNWLRGYGSILIPTSGVAHVKAAGLTKATVHLVCDNVINTWRLQVVGLDCVLDSAELGWRDMEKNVHKLRAKSLANLRANATGGVLSNGR